MIIDQQDFKTLFFHWDGISTSTHHFEYINDTFNIFTIGKPSYDGLVKLVNGIIYFQVFDINGKAVNYKFVQLEKSFVTDKVGDRMIDDIVKFMVSYY